MVSFGDVLRKHRGIGPGFDFARIALAMSVLGYHTWEIVYGDQVDTAHGRVTWILRMAILPMFFGLSGFLVAGSAQRLGLRSFILNRGFRIVPALAVEILLSALVLGPLLTAYVLQDYFGDPKLYLYFLNGFGIVQFKLPGVFLTNPFAEVVNGSLWTVPHEILCYVAMALIIILKLTKKNGVLLGLALCLVACGFAASGLVDDPPQSAILRAVFSRYWQAGLGPILVPCFLLGALCYNLRDRIPFDGRLFLASVGFLVTVGAVAPERFWEITPLAFLACPAMIYIVCYVGLTRIPPLPLFSSGDYSYGVYLYGFPIQQSIVHLFPTLRNVYLVLALSLVAATAFAMLSWHLIEKPLLKLRKRSSLVGRLETMRAHAEPLPIGEPRQNQYTGYLKVK